MIGTKQLQRIAYGVRRRGAKLVLVGDPEQLQPINAGTPFKDLVERTDAAEITEIRRQRHEWQRAASFDLANGRQAEALAAYSSRGAVEHVRDV